MDYVEVQRLADQLRETFEAELQAKKHLLDSEEIAEGIKAPILAASVESDALNGKNQRTWDAQEAAILLDNAGYQFALGQTAIHQSRVDAAALDRKHAEALIGLTKAWLNSQQGTGHLLVECTTEEMLQYGEAIDHVKNTYNPSEVFPDSELIAWAEGFGLVRVDVPETGPGRDV